MLKSANIAMSSADTYSPSQLYQSHDLTPKVRFSARLLELKHPQICTYYDSPNHPEKSNNASFPTYPMKQLVNVVASLRMLSLQRKRPYYLIFVCLTSISKNVLSNISMLHDELVIQVSCPL